MNTILGKYAAVPTIIKSFERSMMNYMARFKMESPAVSKIRIEEALGLKHTQVAKLMRTEPKWMLRKEDIDDIV